MMLAYSDASRGRYVGHMAWVVALHGVVVAEGRTTTRSSPVQALELRAAHCAIQACREVAKANDYRGAITVRTDCLATSHRLAKSMHGSVAVEWERRGITALGSRADELASQRMGWRR